MESVIRVATINIYNDRSRWAERRELLVRGLAEQSTSKKLSLPGGEASS
jgi:hypothetical protein